MNKPEYEILYSQIQGSYIENTYEAIERLNRDVNERIQDGWTVSGGVTSTSQFIMQAMTRTPVKQILHG